ncbi:hypothetical protein [Kocuria sp. U4B]
MTDVHARVSARPAPGPDQPNAARPPWGRPAAPGHTKEQRHLW